jgi:hypothetical protein
VLPRGFVRIRHFGYLASAHRTALLALARTRSLSARLPTSAQSPHRQLPVSHLALPTLRSQHAHRAQPYLAATRLPMQTVRLFLIPTPSHRSQTCAGTSSHIYALTAKLRPYHLSVSASSPPNYPFHACLPRIAPSPASHFHTLPRVHLGRVSPSAP